jgi:hypothetical protein
MYEYLLYDELTLWGVTYGRDFCMMKQKSWFLPKLYNGNFPSNDHCVTRKSWFQDASGKTCFDAKQHAYTLKASSNSFMHDKGRLTIQSLKGSLAVLVITLMKAI